MNDNEENDNYYIPKALLSVFICIIIGFMISIPLIYAKERKIRMEYIEKPAILTNIKESDVSYNLPDSPGDYLLYFNDGSFMVMNCYEGYDFYDWIPLNVKAYLKIKLPD